MEPYVCHMKILWYQLIIKRYQAIKKFELCFKESDYEGKTENLRFLLKMFQIASGFYHLTSRYGELFSVFQWGFR